MSLPVTTPMVLVNALLRKHTGKVRRISISLFLAIFIPIRVTQYRDFKAVNYHRWSVCKAAEILGKKEQLPVYKFLKEPLIRKFGQAWYKALEECAEEWKKQREE